MWRPLPEYRANFISIVYHVMLCHIIHRFQERMITPSESKFCSHANHLINHFSTDSKLTSMTSCWSWSVTGIWSVVNPSMSSWQDLGAVFEQPPIPVWQLWQHRQRWDRPPLQHTPTGTLPIWCLKKQREVILRWESGGQGGATCSFGRDETPAWHQAGGFKREEGAGEVGEFP